MNNENTQPATEANASQPNWRTLPFDPATNFSLLGWLMDKFIKGKRLEEKVDLRLYE